MGGSLPRSGAKGQTFPAPRREGCVRWCRWLALWRRVQDRAPRGFRGGIRRRAERTWRVDPHGTLSSSAGMRLVAAGGPAVLRVRKRTLAVSPSWRGRAGTADGERPGGTDAAHGEGDAGGAEITGDAVDARLIEAGRWSVRRGQARACGVCRELQTAVVLGVPQIAKARSCWDPGCSGWRVQRRTSSQPRQKFPSTTRQLHPRIGSQGANILSSFTIGKARVVRCREWAPTRHVSPSRASLPFCRPPCCRTCLGCHISGIPGKFCDRLSQLGSRGAHEPGGRRSTMKTNFQGLPGSPDCDSEGRVNEGAPISAGLGVLRVWESGGWGRCHCLHAMWDHSSWRGFHF